MPLRIYFQLFGILIFYLPLESKKNWIDLEERLIESPEYGKKQLSAEEVVHKSKTNLCQF